MKTKLLLAALLSWASLCFAQVVFSNANLRLAPDAQIQENNLQETFSRLDKSRIPNGPLPGAYYLKVFKDGNLVHSQTLLKN